MTRAALLAPLLVGCLADDWNGQPYTGPGTTSGDTGVVVTGSDDLAGSWRSAGGDVSGLLADEPFRYVRVDAVFEPSGAYEVIGTDADGAEWPLVGTWTADPGTPGTVTLEQAEPYVATAVGIWQVEGGTTLTYEVVQTSPDYGFQPPTPGSGFGSTTGPGLTPGINVQTYRRVE